MPPANQASRAGGARSAGRRSPPSRAGASRRRGPRSCASSNARRSSAAIGSSPSGQARAHAPSRSALSPRACAPSPSARRARSAAATRRCSRGSPRSWRPPRSAAPRSRTAPARASSSATAWRPARPGCAAVRSSPRDRARAAAAARAAAGWTAAPARGAGGRRAPNAGRRSGKSTSTAGRRRGNAPGCGTRRRTPPGTRPRAPRGGRRTPPGTGRRWRNTVRASHARRAVALAAARQDVVVAATPPLPLGTDRKMPGVFTASPLFLVSAPTRILQGNQRPDSNPTLEVGARRTPNRRADSGVYEAVRDGYARPRQQTEVNVTRGGKRPAEGDIRPGLAAKPAGAEARRAQVSGRRPPSSVTPTLMHVDADPDAGFELSDAAADREVGADPRRQACETWLPPHCVRW